MHQDPTFLDKATPQRVLENIRRTFKTSAITSEAPHLFDTPKGIHDLLVANLPSALNIFGLTPDYLIPTVTMGYETGGHSVEDLEDAILKGTHFDERFDELRTIYQTYRHLEDGCSAARLKRALGQRLQVDETETDLPEDHGSSSSAKPPTVSKRSKGLFGWSVSKFSVESAGASASDAEKWLKTEASSSKGKGEEWLSSSDVIEETKASSSKGKDPQQEERKKRPTAEEWVNDPNT